MGYPCCSHCACNPKSTRPVHSYPCSRCQDIDQAPSNCPVCEGFRVLPRLHVLGLVCTCGAGPLDELTLHDVACDTVPCPFCQLADTSLAPRVLR